MALINCKECGAQVSTQAKSCPSCGAKIKKPTSIITWIFLGLMYITIYIYSRKLKVSYPKLQFFFLKLLA